MLLRSRTRTTCTGSGMRGSSKAAPIAEKAKPAMLATVAAMRTAATAAASVPVAGSPSPCRSIA
jgi:hypothetical protein